MKKHHVLKVFTVGILIFLLSGCTMFKGKTADQKREAAQTKVENVQKQIAEKADKIEDKGKAFVYGAKYSISKLSVTNKPVEVKIAENYVDLAQLTLGQPSYADAEKIRVITDGLLLEKNKEILEQKLLVSNSVAEIKGLKKQISEYDKKIQTAEKQLKDFGGDIIKITQEKDLLAKQKDIAEGKLSELDKKNSVLAAKWEEDNSWSLSNLNPFKDLFSFFKKLLGWGLFLGIVFIIFKGLEIAFPELGILSTIGSFFVRTVSKLIPKAIGVAGFVTSKTWDGFKGMTVAIENTLTKLNREDIEGDLIKDFPDSFQFDKKTVLSLLEKHSAQIETILKSELQATENPATYSLLQTAKQETGIKKPTENIKI